MRWLFKGCFICMFHFAAYAQKENNQWVISWYGPIAYHSLVEFNSPPPDTSTLISPARFFLTIASICDSSGQLLFYSNGHTVYNRQHDTLWNGAGINPGWLTNYYTPQNGMGVPQGALVFPRPGYSGQYLLFYVSGEWCPVGSTTEVQPVKLAYSIIDMSLDGGLGGIVPGKKDLIAYYDTLIYGRLTAVKHGNGRDWWVIAHKSNTNIYNKLLVTPDTMILYQQQIGRPHTRELVYQQSAFSPVGDKFVMGITIDSIVWNGGMIAEANNVIDLYDFDRCTGLLSNVRYIEIPDKERLAAGCSFSPDGRWLYVSNWTKIYQYDTWAANINSTRLLVAERDTGNLTFQGDNLFYSHLLAPDGKIYITNLQTAANLHVINEPNHQGIACNVTQQGLKVPVVNTFVLPNAVNYSLGPVAGSACDTLLSVTISEIERTSISVSPNPATSQITLQYSPPKTTGHATIYNVLGEAVYQLTLPPNTTRQQLSIAHLPAGIYLIMVEADGKSGVKRFVRLAGR